MHGLRAVRGAVVQSRHGREGAAMLHGEASPKRSVSMQVYEFAS